MQRNGGGRREGGSEDRTVSKQIPLVARMPVWGVLELKKPYGVDDGRVVGVGLGGGRAHHSHEVCGGRRGKKGMGVEGVELLFFLHLPIASGEKKIC